MGFLTKRERKIMEMLKNGKSVRKIGNFFKVSDTSISRSISNIRTKALDLEDDIEFLTNIGFLEIKKNKLVFLSTDKDPKSLGEKKE